MEELVRRREEKKRKMEAEKNTNHKTKNLAEKATNPTNTDEQKHLHLFQGMYVVFNWGFTKERRSSS